MWTWTQRSYAARSVLLNQWSDSGACWSPVTWRTWSAAFIRGRAQTHLLSAVWLLLSIQMIIKSSFFSCLKSRNASVLVLRVNTRVCQLPGDKPSRTSHMMWETPSKILLRSIIQIQISKYSMWSASNILNCFKLICHTAGPFKMKSKHIKYTLFLI